MANTKSSNSINNQDEELIIKASLLQKQLEEITLNLEQIEKSISELHLLSDNLNLFNEPNKEAISLIGGGIYAKTHLSGKNLLVNVGSNVFVEKTIDETKNSISSQIRQLNEIRLQLKAQLEIYSHLLREALQEIQKPKISKI
ncbi:MAG: prefoldin subunit alpha [Candidatus Pacearchaeota archaeon]|nr:prefoldin subunit alpha [Candidatus Pacearchaeota archaeon]